MNLFPSRNQWNKWSLPSKLTAIGAYLAMGSFVIYLLTLSLSLFPHKTSIDKHKLNNNLAQALFFTSNTEYNKAEAIYSELLSNTIDNPLIKDIYYWRADNFSRDGQFEKSYECFEYYYKNFSSEPSEEELNNLAWIKLVSLFNEKKTDQLLDLAIKLTNSKYSKEINDFLLLAYSFKLNINEFLETIISKEFILSTDPSFRINQYDIWNNLSDYLWYSNKYSIFNIFIDAMRNKAFPSEFRDKEFNIYLPYVNLTLLSLRRYKEYQIRYAKVLNNYDEKERRLFSLKNDIIINFGMDIGSIVALEKFFHMESEIRNLLTKTLQKIESNGETIIQLIPFQGAQKHKGVFCISGKPIKDFTSTLSDKEWSDFLNNTLPIDSIKYRVITFNNNKILSNKIIFKESSLINYNYYANKINQNNIFVTSLGGTGHFLNIQQIDINKCNINEQFIEDKYTYHTNNLFWAGGSTKTKTISWRFEIESSCEPNVSRKVFGNVKTTIDSTGKITDWKINYSNPALEFWQNLDSTNAKMQILLTEQLNLDSIKIQDRKFNNYLTGNYELCLVRTQIDEAYTRLPVKIAPRISILQIHFTKKPNEYKNPQKIKIADEGNYILLVEKAENKIRILGVYEVEHGNKLRSIVFE